MNHPNTQTHKHLFAQSLKYVPGGVHSPVRSFKGLDSTPRFIERADSAYLYDIEGNDYIDFCMSFGPLILGHKNPIVRDALTHALDRGWSYGTCEPYSLELAEFLIERLSLTVSNIEQIRFVNSGTEAVITALRLARGITGRDKIIKFNGCYHGHSDSMLIKAGSGLAGQAVSSSLGVTLADTNNTLIFELDDINALKNAFLKYQGQIAAIIVEPLPANNGLLPQAPDYLKSLREICDEFETLLIFDEVISGFRIGFGGMSSFSNVRADIVTYGKIIGGGLPVGAVASSRENMEKLAPLGPVYQAGTLSANPLAMVGGLATLKQLNEKSYETLEVYTKNICDIFKKFFNNFDGGKFKDINIVRQGSLFWFTKGLDIKKVCDIPSTQGIDFTPLFEELLKRGVYLAPNAYEVGFVSLSHDGAVQRDLCKRLEIS